MDVKKTNRPFSVVLTGGIGSGKSTVGNMFQDLGVLVLDADHITHDLLGADSPIASLLSDHFGSEIIEPNRAINRTLLGDIIFASPEKRKWLENIIHPRVYAKLRELALQSEAPYCLMLIPLLFETHHEDDFDTVLVVDIPAPVQIARVKARTGFSDEKIQQIIAAQISREERLEKADDVLDNTGDLQALRERVLGLHEKYLGLARSKTTEPRA